MAKHTTEGYALTIDGTAVAAVASLPVPRRQRSEIDVTTLDSTGIETLPGFVDGGTITVGVVFNPDDAGQQAMIANEALGDGTTAEFIATAPASSTTETTPGNWTFDAYVAAWGPAPLTPNSRADAEFELRIQGAPTYTAPTT